MSWIPVTAGRLCLERLVKGQPSLVQLFLPLGPRGTRTLRRPVCVEERVTQDLNRTTYVVFITMKNPVQHFMVDSHFTVMPGISFRQ